MSGGKTGLRRALVRIAVYVLAMSLYENLGAERFDGAGRFALAGALLLLLLADMRRGGERFGVVPLGALPYGKLLYLLPMLALATVNLWRGAVLRYSVRDTVFSAGAMLMIGAVEELLFRGWLLRALLRDSAKSAVLISGLTFGLGHIVNLLNGAELVSTLLQLIYAFAIGVMLAVFMVRAKNLVPCCVFHGGFNALSVFANEAGMTVGYEAAVCAAISAIALLYAAYLWKREAEA